MKEEVAGLCPVDCNWEQRQKHASFFQNQIFLTQQIHLSEMKSTTIILTVASSVVAFYLNLPLSQIIVMIISSIIWYFVVKDCRNRFYISSSRIRDEYLRESASDFPGFRPYTLEIYLLILPKSTPSKPQEQPSAPLSEKDKCGN